jgi:hypothetical protein
LLVSKAWFIGSHKDDNDENQQAQMPSGFGWFHFAALYLFRHMALNHAGLASPQFKAPLEFKISLSDLD